MLKRSLFFLAGIFFISNTIIAQNNGLMPLSGLRYFKEGVYARSMTVKMDGGFLLSNRVPLNKEIEIAVQQPTGLTDDKGKWFIGAELTITSLKGDVLSKNPNVYLANESTGFAKNVKELSVKFGLTPLILKTNNACMIKLRFYDQRAKTQLRLEWLVTIANPNEAVLTSKTAMPIKGPEGTFSMITGLKAKDMVVSVDTTIRKSPKMAYTSLEISAVEGSSINGIFAGKESFWVYDQELNEVKITDILLKQVKGSMESNNVDYTLKIPYRLKALLGKTFVVRFRWESPDKSQVIDVVTTK
jgi:hypothetical protein